MSGICFMNNYGLYNFYILGDNFYLVILLNSIPYILQLLGTFTLIIIDKCPKLKRIFFKSRRKSIIKWDQLLFV